MKRGSSFQLTQLAPTDDYNTSTENDNSDHEDDVKNSINPTLMKNRKIIKPRRFLESSKKPAIFKASIKPMETLPSTNHLLSVSNNKANATSVALFDTSLHMHGLNKSFISHLEKILESNPFKDLSEYFKTYTKHLQNINANVDKSTSVSASDPCESTSTDSSNLTKTFPPPLITPSFSYTDVLSKSSTDVSSPTNSQIAEFNKNIPLEPSPHPLILPFVSENLSKNTVSSNSLSSATNSSSTKEFFLFNFLNGSNSTTSNSFSSPSQPIMANTPFSFASSNTPFSFASMTPIGSKISASINLENQQDENKITEKNDDEPTEPPLIEEIDPSIKGPGEESDSVLLALKCRIFTMALDQSEKIWQDLGIASLRVNEIESMESSPKYRIIARAQGSISKLHLNSYISGLSLMPLKASEKGLSFICMNPDDKLSCYKIRLKLESSTQELHSLLEKYSGNKSQ